MPRVRSNGIDLEYDSHGDAGNPPLVLVMGLGAQLIDWPEGFAGQLADQGFHVLRYDNRDSGRSTWQDDLGVPKLRAVLAGTVPAPYSLRDLSEDLLGFLDALGIERAHVVGASMGGMIVQQFAIDHQDRLLSLTSIMSTTGDHAVGHATPAAQEALTAPPAPDRATAIAQGVATARTIGSAGFDVTDDQLRDRITATYDRGYHPAGTARQFAAILTAPDRTEGCAG